MGEWRCTYCGRFFRPDPRGSGQRNCGKAACRRARNREKLRRWRALHPDHGQRYAAKERAWAKAYPDYWRHYRAQNPAYAERENRRRVERRRRAKRSANETGMRQALVENLRVLGSTDCAEVSANETGFLRRLSAVEECLRSTAALALSAK